MASSNRRMSFVVISLVTMLLLVCSGMSMATVYEVGDSVGWTSMGNVDYQGWASNYNFQVGDTLVFNYNSQFHDVEQVSTSQDFQACNSSSPIATYTSGSDLVTLDRVGHFYFLCGVPGHCEAGQKLDVLVNPPAAPPSSTATATSVGVSPVKLPDTTAPIGAASSKSSTHFPLALGVLLVPMLCFAI